jgi:hypothetical protein
MPTVIFDGQNILTGEFRKVEAVDQVSGSDYIFDLSGNGTYPIDLTPNQGGVGLVKYRNLTNHTGWFGPDTIYGGEHIFI